MEHVHTLMYVYMYMYLVVSKFFKSFIVPFKIYDLNYTKEKGAERLE